MMEIRKGDDAVLYETAETVKEGEDVSELVDCMFSAMYRGKGIGLAANQVGVLFRVIVLDVRGLKQEIINPVITKKSKGKGLSVEGCLSFPNKTAALNRYKRITVEGVDKNWNVIKLKVNGLTSQCVQHEIDHLNGITIRDL